MLWVYVSVALCLPKKIVYGNCLSEANDAYLNSDKHMLNLDQALRFLVIDDDEIDRMLVRRSLRKAGFKSEIVEIDDAEKTLSAICNAVFDFCFLDYLLPDSDGLSLLRSLRESGFNAPVVVLTGQGDEEVAVELMKAGASDYINKSTVTPERLKQTVDNALRLYRAENLIKETQRDLRTTNELLRDKNEVLKRQKQEIQEKNRELIEVARIKSEFMATMSHELRTPMNSIVGFSQVLERRTYGKLNAQQGQMVERILSNSQQLQALINDLLDFSKIGAGNLRLQPKKLNLQKLIGEITEDFRPVALEKRIEIYTNYNLENPEVISDSVRLSQILTNLLTNAVKFTDSGSIRVWIESKNINPQVESGGDRGVEKEAGDRHNEWLILGVQDTGIGIEKDRQALIFDAFRQVDQSMTRKRGGTGLGLAIVRSLTEAMGGHIELQSTPDQGSEFKIILPRYLPKDLKDSSNTLLF
ncbi:MAG: ATP-binding protein [Cyanophyceae cyanobacterium]